MKNSLICVLLALVLLVPLFSGDKLPREDVRLPSSLF